MRKIRPERLKQGSAANGQVLTYDAGLGQWVGANASSGFTNGQSISVNNITVNGQIAANSTVTFGSGVKMLANTSYGGTGHVLTTNGLGDIYWSATDGVTAYANAVAYAASNTYVNNQLSNKANNFNAVLTGTTGIRAISANSSAGNPGQVLTSNGDGLYWSTPSAGVNTAATYSWTNTHTFNSNAIFVSGLSVRKIFAGATGDNAGFSGQILVTGGPTGSAYWSSDITVRDISITRGMFVSGSFGTTGQVLHSNGSSGAYWASPAVANGSVGTLDQVLAAGNTTTKALTVGPLTVDGQFNSNNVITLGTSVRLMANGSYGTSGQVLTTTGSGLYWSTPGLANGSVGTLDQVLAAGNTTTKALTVGPLTVNGSITANGSTGSAGQILTSNGTHVYWESPTVANGSVGTLDQVLAAGNTSIRGVRIGTLTLDGIFNTNTAIALGTAATIVANNSDGSAGQVLTSRGNGTGLYWSTPASATNTSATYLWSNAHTFSSNVSMTGRTTFGGQTLSSFVTLTGWANTTIDLNTAAANYFVFDWDGVNSKTIYPYNTPPNGYAYSCTLRIKNTSTVANSANIGWTGGSFYWAQGSAPTIAARCTTIIFITTIDGGATWIGSAISNVPTP